MASRSIRVNALLPGWVDSDMWQSQSSSSLPFPYFRSLPGTQRRCRSSFLSLTVSFSRPHAGSPNTNFLAFFLLIYKPLWYRALSDLKPELQQAYLKDTPLHRVADPAEVADAAVFLATNEFANNCVLNLDGGLSAA